MDREYEILEEVPGLYRIILLRKLRRTPGVYFDLVPRAALGEIGAIDRVLHDSGAISPGAVGEVERPWYMHPFQEDNLVVLHGTRHVELYTREHGRIESFMVSPNRILKGERLLYDGPALLSWPTGVFHRIKSGEEGSASINLAIHYPGIDPRTNFNIYSLDTSTGDFTMIREGFRDQF